MSRNGNTGGMRRGAAFANLRLTSLWSAVATMIVAVGLALVARPATVAAQHETAADLLDGERAFKNNCANCHGPDGDQIAGIDLGRGRFRRPRSDDALMKTIRTGIPNTPMPATNMTVEQAQKIVAYLRSRAADARNTTIA